MEAPRSLKEAVTVVDNVHYENRDIVIHHVDAQMFDLQRDEQLSLEHEAKMKVSRIEWVVWEMDAILEEGIKTEMVMGENEDGSPLTIAVTEDIFQTYLRTMRGQMEYLGYEYGLYEDWMQDPRFTPATSNDLPN